MRWLLVAALLLLIGGCEGIAPCESAALPPLGWIMAEHHLTGFPEWADNGIWCGPVAAISAWTAADERRIVYDISTRTLYYGTNSAWVAITPHPVVKHNYGTGADGNATISSNTSLSRPMHYNNLTLSAGNLNPNGYPFFVYGTLTIGSGYHVQSNGLAGEDGSNGSAGVGGDGGSWSGSGVATGNMLYAARATNGGAGGNGGKNSAGVGGTSGDGFLDLMTDFDWLAPDTNIIAGASGGDGGAATNAGGTGGGYGYVATGYTPRYDCRDMWSLTRGTRYVPLAGAAYWRTFCGMPPNTGSGGGGGGGSDSPGATAGGGGGGASSGWPGGYIVVCAYNIVDNNAGGDGIRALGGAGGNGGNGANASGALGNAGGGGGGAGGTGGNGGLIVIVTNSILSLSASSVVDGGAAGTGGTGGSPYGTGAAGSAGSNGNAGNDGFLFTFSRIS